MDMAIDALYGARILFNYMLHHVLITQVIEMFVSIHPCVDVAIIPLPMHFHKQKWHEYKK